MHTAGDDPASGTIARNDSSAVVRLKRRADFVRVGKGRRWHAKTLTLQAAPRPTMLAENEAQPVARLGFTLTKKVGCAVVRNRARRRLREAVRLASGLPFQPDFDYVVVGRIDAIRLPFDTLKRELASALRAVHAAGGSSAAKRNAAGRPAGDDKARRGGRIAETERAKGADPARFAPERTRPKP